MDKKEEDKKGEKKKESKFCENTDVNKTMVEAYKMAKAIPFNSNSDIYFNQIYEEFSNRMATDEEFLKDMVMKLR